MMKFAAILKSGYAPLEPKVPRPRLSEVLSTSTSTPSMRHGLLHLRGPLTLVLHTVSCQRVCCKHCKVIEHLLGGSSCSMAMQFV